jgi:hypothetical protein
MADLVTTISDTITTAPPIASAALLWIATTAAAAATPSTLTRRSFDQRGHVDLDVSLDGDDESWMNPSAAPRPLVEPSAPARRDATRVGPLRHTEGVELDSADRLTFEGVGNRVQRRRFADPAGAGQRQQHAGLLAMNAA